MVIYRGEVIIMMNTIFIWCVGIIFVSVATGLFFIHKYKRCNLDVIVQYITVLANTAIVLTLVYAIFSYTHTVYPTYEKEQRLIEAEQKASDLSSENAVLLNNLENTISNYQNARNEILALQSNYSETLHMNFEYKNQISNLNFKMWGLEKNLVSTIAISEVNSIIDNAIYSGQSSTTNYQEKILEVANEKIGKYSQDAVEYRAYYILLRFAEEQLNSDSTYSDALNIMIFSITEYDVLYPTLY